MEIKTNRLILRDLRMSDAKSIAKHANNLNVTKNLLVVPHPYRLSDARSFLSRNLRKLKKKTRESYSLGITFKGADEVIGIVTITDVDAFHRTATLGYWLSEEYWRKGIMSEAARAIIDFAFKKLKLRRINVSAFTGNPASNGLIRKLGFTHEGTSRKKVRSKATGIIHDEHDYGLLREEWK
ncbi:MAG: GNAT family protein [Nanoarchaeota archaeon]